ncbi:hypothetical protein ACCS64_39500, partial [Rhizobium ruizarguesonis]
AVFVDDFANPHKLPVLDMLTERLQAECLLTVLININRHFDHVHALINADQRQFDALILFGQAVAHRAFPRERPYRTVSR